MLHSLSAPLAQGCRHQYLVLWLMWNCRSCGCSQEAAASRPALTALQIRVCMPLGCTSPSFPFVLFIILRTLFSYGLHAPSPAPRWVSRPLQEPGFPGTALIAFCSAEMPYPEVQLEGWLENTGAHPIVGRRRSSGE